METQTQWRNQCPNIICLSFLKGCSKGGVVYKIGQVFPAGDGCNKCECLVDGTIKCGTDFCGKFKCHYDGLLWNLDRNFDLVQLLMMTCKATIY